MLRRPAFITASIEYLRFLKYGDIRRTRVEHKHQHKINPARFRKKYRACSPNCASITLQSHLYYPRNSIIVLVSHYSHISIIHRTPLLCQYHITVTSLLSTELDYCASITLQSHLYYPRNSIIVLVSHYSHISIIHGTRLLCQYHITVTSLLSTELHYCASITLQSHLYYPRNSIIVLVSHYSHISIIHGTRLLCQYHITVTSLLSTELDYCASITLQSHLYYPRNSIIVLVSHYSHISIIHGTRLLCQYHITVTSLLSTELDYCASITLQSHLYYPRNSIIVLVSHYSHISIIHGTPLLCQYHITVTSLLSTELHYCASITLQSHLYYPRNSIIVLVSHYSHISIIHGTPLLCQYHITVTSLLSTELHYCASITLQSHLYYPRNSIIVLVSHYSHISIIHRTRLLCQYHITVTSLLSTELDYCASITLQSHLYYPRNSIIVLVSHYSHISIIHGTPLLCQYHITVTSLLSTELHYCASITLQSHLYYPRNSIIVLVSHYSHISIIHGTPLLCQYHITVTSLLSTELDYCASITLQSHLYYPRNSIIVLVSHYSHISIIHGTRLLCQYHITVTSLLSTELDYCASITLQSHLYYPRNSIIVLVSHYSHISIIHGTPLLCQYHITVTSLLSTELHYCASITLQSHLYYPRNSIIVLVSHYSHISIIHGTRLLCQYHITVTSLLSTELDYCASITLQSHLYYPRNSIIVLVSHYSHISIIHGTRLLCQYHITVTSLLSTELDYCASITLQSHLYYPRNSIIVLVSHYSHISIIHGTRLLCQYHITVTSLLSTELHYCASITLQSHLYYPRNSIIVLVSHYSHISIIHGTRLLCQYHITVTSLLSTELDYCASITLQSHLYYPRNSIIMLVSHHSHISIIHGTPLLCQYHITVTSLLSTELDYCASITLQSHLYYPRNSIIVLVSHYSHISIIHGTRLLCQYHITVTSLLSTELDYCASITLQSHLYYPRNSIIVLVSHYSHISIIHGTPLLCQYHITVTSLLSTELDYCASITLQSHLYYPRNSIIVLVSHYSHISIIHGTRLLCQYHITVTSLLSTELDYCASITLQSHLYYPRNSIIVPVSHYSHISIIHGTRLLCQYHITVTSLLSTELDYCASITLQSHLYYPRNSIIVLVSHYSHISIIHGTRLLCQYHITVTSLLSTELDYCASITLQSHLYYPRNSIIVLVSHYSHISIIHGTRLLCQYHITVTSLLSTELDYCASITLQSHLYYPRNSIIVLVSHYSHISIIHGTRLLCQYHITVTSLLSTELHYCASITLQSHLYYPRNSIIVLVSHYSHISIIHGTPLLCQYHITVTSLLSTELHYCASITLQSHLYYPRNSIIVLASHYSHISIIHGTRLLCQYHITVTSLLSTELHYCASITLQSHLYYPRNSIIVLVSHYSHISIIHGTRLLCQYHITVTSLLSTELDYCASITLQSHLYYARNSIIVLVSHYSHISIIHGTRLLCQYHITVTSLLSTELDYCASITLQSHLYYPRNSIIVLVSHYSHIFIIHGTRLLCQYHITVTSLLSTELDYCASITLQSHLYYPRNSIIVLVSHYSHISIIHGTRLLCQYHITVTSLLSTELDYCASITLQSHLYYPRNSIIVLVSHYSHISIIHRTRLLCQYHITVTSLLSTELDYCASITLQSHLYYPRNSIIVLVSHYSHISIIHGTRLLCQYHITVTSLLSTELDYCASITLQSHLYYPRNSIIVLVSHYSHISIIHGTRLLCQYHITVTSLLSTELDYCASITLQSHLYYPWNSIIVLVSHYSHISIIHGTPLLCQYHITVTSLLSTELHYCASITLQSHLYYPRNSIIVLVSHYSHISIIHGTRLLCQYHITVTSLLSTELDYCASITLQSHLYYPRKSIIRGF